MPYVITEPCIGTKDTACVDVCPVDCIYPGDYNGEEFMVIDPTIWRDVLLSNREEVLRQSLRFRHALDAIEHVMRSGNGEALEDLIRQSADARANWQMSAGAKTPGSR